MVKKSSFYPPPPRKRGPVGPPARTELEVREEAPPSPAPVSKTPVFSYIRDLVDHDTAVPPLAVAELLADYDRLRERYDEALVEIVDLESERTAEQDREQQLVEDVNKYKREAEDARQAAREERAELLRQVDEWRRRYNRLSDAINP